MAGRQRRFHRRSQCAAEGADYIGFGPIYATGSKADAGLVKGLEGLREMVNGVSVPIIAIGGIGIENAGEVMRAGAHGIAVISAVCCQSDPIEATQRLMDQIRMGL